MILTNFMVLYFPLLSSLVAECLYATNAEGNKVFRKKNGFFSGCHAVVSFCSKKPSSSRILVG